MQLYVNRRTAFGSQPVPCGRMALASEPMVPGSLERITALRRLLDANGKAALRIEVDGNVNYEKAPLMRDAGADLFVVGTSSILGPGDLTENIEKMRRLLAERGSR